MKLAEVTKRQRDQAFRQQSQDPGKNIVFTETPAGAGESANPTNPTWDSITGKPTTFPPEPHTIISHSDSPGGLVGNAGKAIVVKADETGFEYGASRSGGGEGAFDYGLITSAVDIAQDWGSLV